MTFSFLGKLFGQSKSDTTMNRATNEMNDIQTLINSTFPFVEDLLKKHGEFYPVASAIEPNDSITMVGTHDGNDKPLSQIVIDNLKTVLKQGASKGQYKTIAIFYDVKTVDPNTKEKTDAIAVFVEHKEGKTAYIFYYPYKLTANRELTISKSFGSGTDKEIFKNK